MKKFAGLVVILAVLVLGSYYVMGLITERTVKHNLTNMNQTTGVHVDIAQYDRGWYTSNALFNWQITVPEHTVTENGQTQTIPAQEYKMSTPVKIYHGPIIFANDTVKFGMGYAYSDVPLPAEYNDQFNATFTPDSVKPEMQMTMFVNYLTNVEIGMAIPQFKVITKKDNAEFDWKGLDSSVTVTSNQEKIKGDATLDGMQITKGTVKASVGEISTKYDLHLIPGGLYLGDASLTLPSLVVNDKDQLVFELDDFDLQSSSNVEDGLFTSHFQSSLDKLVANGKTFGPGNVEIAIRNLDADVLMRINTQAQQIQQGTDVEKQQALLAILPEVPKLFSRGAELEVSSLSFKMPEGTVEGNLLVTMPKGESSNPFEMMQKIQGSGKIKIPAAVLKDILDSSNKQKLLAQAQTATAPAGSDVAQQIQQTSTPAPAAVLPADADQQINALTTAQLNAMMESGLVTKQGDDVVVELNFDQGKLQINGKPFNPAMLKF